MTRSDALPPDEEDLTQQCFWHDGLVAALLVRVCPEWGPSRWTPSCVECAEDFEPGDVRPWVAS